MARRPKKVEEGAPAWVLTYGDMMSLLLTFFILLAAMSELKKEERWQAVVLELKNSFGMSRGAGGRVVVHEYQKVSLIPLLEEMEKKRKEINNSQTAEPGIDGKVPNVTRIREGLQFSVGGRVTFAPGSAQLTPESINQLRSVANLIRGKSNKVEIRGHASSMDLAQGSQYPDLWALSHARAKAAMDALVKEGVKPEQLRLVSIGDHEPLVTRKYTMGEQEPNRRVEVIVSEALIQEMAKPETAPRG